MRTWWVRNRLGVKQVALGFTCVKTPDKSVFLRTPRSGNVPLNFCSVVKSLPQFLNTLQINPVFSNNRKAVLCFRKIRTVTIKERLPINLAKIINSSLVNYHIFINLVDT